MPIFYVVINSITYSQHFLSLFRNCQLKVSTLVDSFSKRQHDFRQIEFCSSRRRKFSKAKTRRDASTESPRKTLRTVRSYQRGGTRIRSPHKNGSRFRSSRPTARRQLTNAPAAKQNRAVRRDALSPFPSLAPIFFSYGRASPVF